MQLSDARWRAAGLGEAAVDALPALVAVVDGAGAIVATNHAWSAFAHAAGSDAAAARPGCSYRDACARVVVGHEADADAVWQGLTGVLRGTVAHFEHAYQAVRDGRERWFVMHGVRLDELAEPLAVAAHQEATTIRTVALERRQRDEVLRLLLLAQREPVPEAARAYAAGALQYGQPAAFAELARAWGAVLDDALESSLYGTRTDVSAAARGLAARLAVLRAGARDVIALHLAAIAERAGAGGRRSTTYAEVGRMVLIEVLGLLVTEYRAASGHTSERRPAGSEKTG